VSLVHNDSRGLTIHLQDDPFSRSDTHSVMSLVLVIPHTHRYDP
jgi:hypothetical protein